MGRSPCCSKVGLNRGAWTATEDKILTDYIKIHGEGRWRNLPNQAGLKRCGKSCRLRWLNYLRPDIKRGNISHDEEELIIRLHKLLGNRWSLIARRLPGRTDNEIKNYWNTYLAKKVQDDRTLSLTKKPNHSSSTNKKKKKKKQVIQPTKNVGLSHQVVRTKAYKCNKIFFTPQPANVEGIAMNPKVLQQPLAMEPYNPPPQFTPCHEDNDMDGFILNFNMDDLCLSEFLDSDFSLPCDTEELSMQDGNISKELSLSPLGHCV